MFITQNRDSIQCPRSSVCCVGPVHAEARSYGRRGGVPGGGVCHVAGGLRVPCSTTDHLFDEHNSAELYPDIVRTLIWLYARLQVRQPGAVYVHSASTARRLQLAADPCCVDCRSTSPGDGEDGQSVHHNQISSSSINSR